MTGRVYAQQAVAAASPDLSPSDEDLMRDLAAGRHEALGPLYSRHASLVFHLAVQSLDRAVAEELVQEVFLTIWRGASSFDPSQGAFRPWLLRLTHWKILNELRHRRRQPVYAHADDEQPLHEVVDQQPGPEEQAWRAEHEDIVKLALEALPPKQRQAIAMAFLQDMTHEQVARALDVPLGTAKTRIRSGLHIMRMHLAPMAASLLGLAVAVLGFRAIQTQITLDRDERVLVMVTTSDLVPLRLTPVTASVPPGAHANYRGRAGNNLAVLTAELLPEPAAGSTYQAWARYGQRWTSLGTLPANPDGSALLIAENPDLSTQPDGVEITLEPSGGSGAPTGTVVLAWPAR